LGAAEAFRAGDDRPQDGCERTTDLEVASDVTRVLASYLENAAQTPLDASVLEALIRRTALQLRAEAAAQADAIRASITATALISFEDGKPYQRLTRHLAARGLTPATYRRKWGLPDDYPMVTADFARRCAERRRPSPWALARS
jgi:predicted transcriptional regulator